MAFAILLALQAYFVDHNAYPLFVRDTSVLPESYLTSPLPYSWFLWIESEDPTSWCENWNILGLTTPVAYLTSRPPDGQVGA